MAMRWISGIALLLFAGCGDHAEQAGRKTQRTSPEYSVEAFYQTVSYGLAGAGGYAFTTEGSRLLVSSDETGVFNAYAMHAATGDKTALTDSAGDAVFGLSWFPDDDRILYTRDQGGNELNHFFVRTLEGAHRDLTPGENLKAGFTGWSADGDAFFVISNERDAEAFDVYRYDADSYERAMIFENAEALAPQTVSPNGRWLALARPRTSADSDLLVADLQSEDKTPRLITAHEGNISHTAMTFTPDSAKLVYGTDEFGEFTQAWTYDLGTAEKAPLIAADWDVMYVAYSEDGRYRVSGIDADARTVHTVLDTVTAEPVSFRELPQGDLGSVRFDRDAARVAFLLENPEIAEEDLVEGQVVRFSSYDELEIPGILYKPNQASAETPVPAMVWVHGGPGGQSRHGYRATIQNLVNHGYAVFAINNRGSSGYGKTFYHLDDRRHGEADLGDVVASRAFLADYDWVDGGRIGIIGGSYGGYI